jgi:fatty-acyl-CoA synthase
MGHPAVREAAVVAVPHPKWDERPVACVVLREGKTATDEELRAHLASGFAKFWLPDRFIFVEALPRTTVGKLNKVQLRQQVASTPLG